MLGQPTCASDTAKEAQDKNGQGVGVKRVVQNSQSQTNDFPRIAVCIYAVQTHCSRVAVHFEFHLWLLTETEMQVEEQYGCADTGRQVYFATKSASRTRHSSRSKMKTNSCFKHLTS